MCFCFMIDRRQQPVVFNAIFELVKWCILLGILSSLIIASLKSTDDDSLILRLLRPLLIDGYRMGKKLLTNPWFYGPFLVSIGVMCLSLLIIYSPMILDSLIACFYCIQGKENPHLRRTSSDEDEENHLGGDVEYPGHGRYDMNRRGETMFNGASAPHPNNISVRNNNNNNIMNRSNHSGSSSSGIGSQNIANYHKANISNIVNNNPNSNNGHNNPANISTSPGLPGYNTIVNEKPYKSLHNIVADNTLRSPNINNMMMPSPGHIINPNLQPLGSNNPVNNVHRMNNPLYGYNSQSMPRNNMQQKVPIVFNN